MNRYVRIFFILLSLVSGVTVFSCGNKSKETGTGQKRIFTCPMHPQVIKDQPGQCPVCGMDLVEKTNNGDAVINDGLSVLLKPVNEFVLSTVKTIHPSQLELPLKIRTTGKVSYDQREINTVSARVTGRIEKLYVKYRFQAVSKGQKLMDIYSKELLTEQQNYIYLLKNDPENVSLISAAEKRLVLQGLVPEQIQALRKSLEPLSSITIYSPYSGHLHEMETGELTPTSGMKGMSDSPLLELTIREGMYLQKGQTVFNIFNPQRIWILLDIFPDDAGKISIGQKVSITFDGEKGHTAESKINFIEPILRNGSKTITVRCYLDNSQGRIKIGTIVKATIEAGNKSGVFVPSTAVIHLGNSDVVFIKEDQIFRTRLVQVGAEIDGNAEILSGLTGKDEIAENSQLLMDSEGFIKISGGQNE